MGAASYLPHFLQQWQHPLSLTQGAQSLTQMNELHVRALGTSNALRHDPAPLPAAVVGGVVWGKGGGKQGLEPRRLDNC